MTETSTDWQHYLSVSGCGCVIGWSGVVWVDSTLSMKTSGRSMIQPSANSKFWSERVGNFFGEKRWLTTWFRVWGGVSNFPLRIRKNWCGHLFLFLHSLEKIEFVVYEWDHCQKVFYNFFAFANFSKNFAKEKKNQLISSPESTSQIFFHELQRVWSISKSTPPRFAKVFATHTPPSPQTPTHTTHTYFENLKIHPSHRSHFFFARKMLSSTLVHVKNIYCKHQCLAEISL